MAFVIAASAAFLLALFFITANQAKSEALLWHLVGGLPLFFAFLYGPCFATVRLALPDERLQFSSDPFEYLNRELEEETRHAQEEQEQEEERIRQINSPTRSPWKCQGCSADNPATFDICWRCERSGERSNEE